MKAIGVVTIGKLIEAHYEKDEHKFEAYAEFIAEAYNEKGDKIAEELIRSKIDGSYKNKPVAVTSDKEIKENIYSNKVNDLMKEVEGVIYIIKNCPKNELALDRAVFRVEEIIKEIKEK